MVAQSRVACRSAVLCHRRHHRLRRILNAAIVAELASWGNTQVQARGLGSYIAAATTAGDFHRIVLGIGTMSMFVVIINRLFWRPLYYFAERKYRLT